MQSVGGLAHSDICQPFPSEKVVNLLANFSQSLLDWAAKLMLLLFYSYFYI